MSSYSLSPPVSPTLPISRRSLRSPYSQIPTVWRLGANQIQRWWPPELVYASAGGGARLGTD
ncbi:hypothetical protein E2562_012387 [Oryza meyeriana var. granulata]|uniref:Uncharacterized protein n=1 Tax=Oryza meyeriana var. granulata TaxID=110450 RepID=A0A6G1C6D3_9ORYZ|nr:hypothetical protein E2562_012387 [Oryza meyeriana var. granulata]